MKKKRWDFPSCRIDFRVQGGSPGLGFYSSLAAGFLLSMAPQASQAMNLYDGLQNGNNLEVNLTTTLNYSGFYRVNDPSSALAYSVTNPTGSLGDTNFKHGVVNNLFSVLPVLDIRDGNYGAHVSGEFYLNTVYLQKNTNNTPGSPTGNSFPSGTRNVNGENARLLDAFVFGQTSWGISQTASLKVGRQTLLWGQSLFFPENGISAGMAPTDIIQAQNLTNAQTQQIDLPTGQVVATYSPNQIVNFQAFYQFEWAPDYFQGVGAYFSSSNILGPGALPLPGGITQAKAITPPIDNPQFGGSVQAALGNYDVGLFALRYDSKVPEFQIVLGPKTQYQFVYPCDIQLYGASFSTTVGPANVAGEISGRTNMPLVAVGTLLSFPANSGNANSNPLYPVGSTWAAQTSAIYVSPGIPFDPGGVSVDGEIAFNHLISVARNRAALAPGRQASAAAFHFIVTPTYFDVLPSLQVTFPIGLEYSLLGRSQIDASMQHGVGSFNFGVTGTYKTNWIASLTYSDFFGKPDPVYNSSADRGYVGLNLQHSF